MQAPPAFSLLLTLKEREQAKKYVSAFQYVIAQTPLRASIFETFR
jgi:hypothetical protein